jgi:hypothetical protein
MAVVLISRIKTVSAGRTVERRSGNGLCEDSLNGRLSAQQYDLDLLSQRGVATVKRSASGTERERESGPNDKVK